MSSRSIHFSVVHSAQNHTFNKSLKDNSYPNHNDRPLGEGFQEFLNCHSNRILGENGNVMFCLPSFFVCALNCFYEIVVKVEDYTIRTGFDFEL